MLWTEAVVHWLHLMAAIVWVGGTLFTTLVVQPAMRRCLDDAVRMRVYADVGRRLTLVQWTTWGILAGTGAWKLWSLRATPSVFAGVFGRILAVKLVLVAAMVSMSLVHSQVWGPALASGTLAAPERAALARRQAFWGGINTLTMVAIVFCAALLRFNPW